MIFTIYGPAAWIFFQNFFHFVYFEVNLNDNQIVQLRSFEIFDIALSITHGYLYYTIFWPKKNRYHGDKQLQAVHFG